MNLYDRVLHSTTWRHWWAFFRL